MSRLQVAAVVFGFTSLGSAPSNATEPLKRSSEHFQLVCHVNNPKIADEALRTLDSTWPLVAA